jgi:hypothetical protein
MITTLPFLHDQIHVIFHKRMDLLEHVSPEHCMNRKGVFVQILVSDGVGKNELTDFNRKAEEGVGFEGLGSGWSGFGDLRFASFGGGGFGFSRGFGFGVEVRLGSAMVLGADYSNEKWSAVMMSTPIEGK